MGRNRKYPKKSFRKTDIKKAWRAAYLSVVTAYNDVRSVIGQAGAKDYSKHTGGQGAKYNNNDIFFKSIDFTVDVEKTVNEVLDTQSKDFFFTCIKDKDYDMSVQSEEFMKFQEELGRAFVSRGIFPLTKYFRGPKEKA